MRKNVLARTNLLVCAVIVLGFIATSVISYRSNRGIFLDDVESVTMLTSEGIYHEIDSVFSKPMNISMTMANDSLLKTFLEEEEARREDQAFLEEMREYLNAYRVKYNYDSVFLASAQTKRYYHFNGLDRTLPKGDPENDWFYQFLESGEEYSLNIDNDEVKTAENDITVFINCRITSPDGRTMGVVGVGFRVDHLQALFKAYEDSYGVQVYLVDQEGNVEISDDRTGYQRANLFEICSFSGLRQQILANHGQAKTFWHHSGRGKEYIVTRFVPALEWHLIVDNDIGKISERLAAQFLREMAVIFVIIVLVLTIITGVIRKYNKRIIELTVLREQDHRNVFQKATEQLYENINELDITHNHAASEATEKYFESLGAPKNCPYDKALRVIAEKQIKEEFRQGYIDTFCPESVKKAFEEGRFNLAYDFMITTDGTEYHWMRIRAHVFFWDEDGSIRMLVYRQNVDAEKRREQYLIDRMQEDSLTGLYNKAATQQIIRKKMAENPNALYAFFILDVDNFKRVNDRLGHAAGDAVLTTFARTIQAQFREDDVVGRIGGDEFAAFMQVPSREAVQRKAQLLVKALCREITTDLGVCRVSTSIGAAIAPEAGADFETLYRHADRALYRTKERGKNGYTIYPQ